MTFRYPWLLLLLALVPLLLWLRHARRRRPTLHFSDGATLGRLPPGLGALLQPLLPLLYGAGLVFLIVALARPQRGLEESVVRTEAVDIVLLVDVSPSMRAEDFSTPGRRVNRLDAAKEVMQAFVRSRPHDRMGLVAFASLPYTVSPLTLDQGWLLQQMERLQSGELGDATGIGTALASAVNRLRDSKAKSKLIVLLTDGVSNTGELSPVNAAEAARALGIKVYTVGAGREGMVPVPVQDPFGGTYYIRQPSEIDEATLRRVAEITGARFFRAQDAQGLRKVYEEIDRMEKTEVEVEQYTRFDERFVPLVVLGLVALALERMLALTRLGRLPG